jgi:peptidoglycan/xylan/chitin deacetylase (PgdA/CDA1 family)
VLITFDDGYTNFASEAVPELVRLQLPSVVFIPTGMIGGRETWVGAHADKRSLMSWDQVRDLAAAKVEFGSHAVTHRDLTTLSPVELDAELAGSSQTLFDELGYRPRTFAAPYGAVNAAVLKQLPKYYEAAFGVEMDRANPGYSIFNLPRIDMHYFRDARRWRSFLNGADAYFQARRGLRALKSSVTRLVAPPSKTSRIGHGT